MTKRSRPMRDAVSSLANTATKGFELMQVLANVGLLEAKKLEQESAMEFLEERQQMMVQAEESGIEDAYEKLEALLVGGSPYVKQTTTEGA